MYIMYMLYHMLYFKNQISYIICHMFVILCHISKILDIWFPTEKLPFAIFVGILQ